MEKKYLAQIIATDNDGLQMISACSSGAKLRCQILNILQRIKFFYCQSQELKLKRGMKIKK